MKPFDRVLHEANMNYLAATIRVLEARGVLNALEVDRACDALQGLPANRVASLAEAVMNQAIMAGAPLDEITDVQYPHVGSMQRELKLSARDMGSMHLLLVD